MTTRLGIFGGTFDPPHLGHLILAAEAYTQCRLDRLLWVLTPHPPHKPNQVITPLDIRLEMVRACLADAPEFELTSVDIDRPPPHYAVYVMGSDSLLNIHTWHRPAEFVRACHRIAVTNRSNEPMDQATLNTLEDRLPGVGHKLQMITSMVLGISSSEIRRRVAENAPVRYYLHPQVYALIQHHKLYRELEA